MTTILSSLDRLESLEPESLKHLGLQNREKRGANQALIRGLSCSGTSADRDVCAPITSFPSNQTVLVTKNRRLNFPDDGPIAPKRLPI